MQFPKELSSMENDPKNPQQRNNQKNNSKLIKRLKVFGEDISKQISEINMNSNNNLAEAQEKQKHMTE